MLYKKNGSPKLSDELFKNPTSEYRGTPFWAWNCKLEKDELLRQIDILKKMGFGGFHMHVRTGMDTPYLSDEYMQLIKSCVEKAKQEKMKAYLYDEDRWPSGAAGGLVTKDKQYRSRYLVFTAVPYGEGELNLFEGSSAQASRTENGTLLACFDIKLDDNGYLVSSRVIDKKQEAEGEKWYAYVETPQESGWFNNQTYVNTLDKKAMDRFIEITYESYNRTIADDFGETVPSIFTDEPQFSRKKTLKFAKEKADVTLPWSDDLPESFRGVYGEDLIAGIPQLIWDLPDNKISLTRYHYHDHICERFTQAFADNCGKWCRDHKLMLTGHMMDEPTLFSQTGALGEAMRSYRAFDLPGIDMLCGWFEYTTAKQTQSAVHQFGREGMLSELYGVTNWDFDFRGHKLHGDWQAALGVTVRVPHLSWVSMAGEAKRDYPASINYQSPWWKEYSYIEDHFARVNTAMTRGVPAVKVGVIHPIESYWLHWGPSEQTAMEREQLDELFQNTAKWLLFGGVDFDFISESLLPTLCDKGAAPLQVGKMAYDVIVVPGCQTLRSTTLERLEAFAKAGGKLVFMGDAPVYENAVPSERGKKLYDACLRISASRGSLLSAVESARMVEIREAEGKMTDNLLHQLRKDGADMWLFIAHGKEPYNKDVSRYQDLRIRIKGCYKPTVYNTLTGEKESIEYKTTNGQTEIRTRMYDYDSLLLNLTPGTSDDECAETNECAYKASGIKFPVLLNYSLSEPNVLLLDKAEYALDDGEMQNEEEILKLDNVCREILSWPSRKESFAQPWVVPHEPLTHTVHLRMTILSDICRDNVTLAVEDAERLTIRFNGMDVPADVNGYYVDKSIKTVTLPGLVRGRNILELDIPFGKRSNIEWCYLLGEFGVECRGSYTKIIEKPAQMTFGDIVPQGLPFYGGNITYECPFECDEGEYAVNVPHYLGALVKVSVDDEAAEHLVFPPYIVKLPKLKKGKHVLKVTLFGHRRNSFGPLHLADLKEQWIGPPAWRSEGDCWSYDYKLCREGIMSAPILLKR